MAFSIAILNYQRVCSFPPLNSPTKKIPKESGGESLEIKHHLKQTSPASVLRRCKGHFLQIQRAFVARRSEGARPKKCLTG